MPAVKCEEAFLSGLLSDLDSSIFDLPPSSQTQAPSQPTQTRPSTSSLATRGGATGSNSNVVKKGIKRESRNQESQEGNGSLTRKRIARENVLSPKKVNGVMFRGRIKSEEGVMKELKPKLEERKENQGLAVGPLVVDRMSSRKEALGNQEVHELMQGIDWDVEDEDEENPVEVEKPLSSRYLRCVVEGIDSSSHRKTTLTVSITSVEGTRKIELSDDWCETEIETGDVINLIGDYDASTNSAEPFTVDRSSGLLIVHPDILVSSTKVADSSHCTRKALLQEIIRSSGAPTPALIYGNMLHETMQRSLLANRWDEEFHKETINEILAENGGTLWSIDLSFDAAREQVLERSKEFGAFAERFIGDKPKADAHLLDSRVAEAARSRLAVLKTLAVEEDIWSPRHGLKGKIDVSLDSSITDSIGFNRRGTMPFEIKTGKANAGMEHRAQTMLYTLLMSDLYNEEIDSGLLYYTQSNEVYQVKAARNEIRGLIHARNRFATILHRRTAVSPFFVTPRSTPALPPQATDDDGDDEEDALWAQLATPVNDIPASSQAIPAEDHSLLPPPIDEERSCRNCYVSDACMVYRRTVEAETAISEDEENPLQVLFDEKTGHLNEVHAKFFSKWEELIRLEEREMLKYRKEIWTMTANEREETGRCLANMKVDSTYIRPKSQADKIHRFVYRLRRADFDAALSGTQSSQSRRTTFGGALSMNDPVVVSLENPSVLAIARGFLLSLEPDSVIIGLDRSLTDIPRRNQQRGDDLIFRIDKDELATGMGRIRDNLLQLFVNGGDERRRKLIVDLETPRFDGPVRARLIPSHLNSDQHDALKKVMSARDYALVLGMPGTGKSTVIAELLKMLVKSNLSVLLTSYTHSAVDNILLKVKDDGLGILRLGNRDKILPSLHQFTLSPEDYSKSLVDIDNKLMRPKIVATTALGINEPIFLKRRFDVCIVDEASQVTLPTCLGPLRFANKFILVGDHNQLPPLVRNIDARQGGLDTSLFKLLSESHPQAVVNLTQQYRMNEDIMLLSNQLVYNGLLKVGNFEVSQRKLRLPKPDGLDGADRWLRDVLDPSRKVVFVDTDQLPAREKKTVSLIENETEALIVLKILKTLSACQVAQEDIGVITLYRQQIHLLERKLRSFPSVEILTADRSQGRDKECIVISCVRSNEAGQVGDLLKDWRRINVCLSRAKSKLIVIGSRSTLSKVEVLERFFKIIDEKTWNYSLPNSILPTLSFNTDDNMEVDQEQAIKLEDAVKEKKRGKSTKPSIGRNPLIRDVYNHLG
ncbi:bifunctional ATP-dependent DNA helicase/ssDNA endodeoxyribonuclease DNA2 [Sporobolomyces salmoneus]|uniref:bifunctional ATP-dependent DNA helicase/ssDNA endodeoxyribonuclease DNA2 n=1 Tax=Sporobolomyces salmoneus TaxID=183962 RepID=UPI00316F46E8